MKKRRLGVTSQKRLMSNGQGEKKHQQDRARKRFGLKITQTFTQNTKIDQQQTGIKGNRNGGWEFVVARKRNHRERNCLKAKGPLEGHNQFQWAITPDRYTGESKNRDSPTRAIDP